MNVVDGSRKCTIELNQRNQAVLITNKTSNVMFGEESQVSNLVFIAWGSRPVRYSCLEL